MGTRGLTMVVKDEKPVVAQYGQWDHYPSGQGATVLAFLRDEDDALGKLIDNLDKVTFLDSSVAEIRAVTSGKFPRWPSLSYGTGEIEAYHQMFPYMDRDHGASILYKIANSKEDVIELTDSSDFVNDSLFCEQAYVIDLDQRTLEVFNGFVKTKNVGRFASDEPTYNEYYPVTLVASWPLDDLPDQEEFENALRDEED